MKFSNTPLPRRGMPIHTFLTGLAFLSVLIFSVGILALSYSEEKKQEDELHQQQFEYIARLAQDEIVHHVRPLYTLMQSFAPTVDTIEDIADDPLAREIFLREQSPVLRNYPALYSVNYTLENGFYVYLINMSHLQEMYDRGMLEGDAQHLFLTVKTEEKARYLLIYNSLENISSQIRVETYDTSLKLLNSALLDSFTVPKTLYWYENTFEAGDLTITGPYNLPSTRELALTLSYPLLTNDGVYSFTLHADEFTTYIGKSLREFKSSFFLVDEDSLNIISSYPSDEHRELLETCEEAVAIDSKILIHSQKDNETVSDTYSVLNKVLAHRNKQLQDLKGEPYKYKAVSHSMLFNNHKFAYELSPIYISDKKMYLLTLTSASNTANISTTSFIKTCLYVLAVFVILIPLTYLATRRISQRIKSISDDAIKMSHNDFNIEPYTNSSIQEIQELQVAITFMRSNLSHYTEYLIKGNDFLEELVHEKTKDLENALEQAHEAVHAKGMFLSTMSHELRTPMNAILGFTYLFEKGNLEEEQLKQLEKISFAGESLLSIINDILDFSKLEAGKLSVENIPFALDEVVKNTMDMLQALATKKNIDFKLEKDDDLPAFLIGDPNRLRQILINLLGNAIKFTEKGSVRLILQRSAKRQALDGDLTKEALATLENDTRKQDSDNSVMISFQVKDTGIGMTEEQKARLFQVYSQADDSISRKFGGSGLGLSIAKELAILMGGDIIVQSIANVGSQFTADLCFEITKDAQLQTAKENVKYKQNALALLVDDRQINLEVANALLKKFTVQSDMITSAKDAQKLLQEKNYDIIFMDIQMPDMDGYTASKLLRSFAEDSSLELKTDVLNVPIIAMTANAMPEDRLKCLEAGMNEHLAKPITPKTVEKILQDWLTVDDKGERIFRETPTK